MTVPESRLPILLGREAELQLVHDAVMGGPSASRALFFRGEPGVGKTALLQEASQSAKEIGRRVITIHGAQYETDIAYSGLNQAVTALESHLGDLRPGQSDALGVVFGTSGDEQPQRLAVFSALLSLLSAAAEGAGLVLCIDDLQWLDPMSTQGLLFIARRLGDSSVTLIATTREAPVWNDDPGEIVIRRIDPLGVRFAEELVHRRFPTLAPHARQRLLSAAEGNPLALLELPIGFDAGVPLALDLGDPTVSLPRRLQSMYAGRVEDLPDITRDLLLVAALEGTGELTVLRNALHDPGLIGLSAAEEAGIVHLRRTDNRLAFRHPLTRSAVAEMATPAQRREAHRRLADALESDIDRRARHLAAATLAPDAGVAEILHQAARRAARRGMEGDDAAVALLISSADLSVSPVDRRRRMAEAAFVGAYLTTTAEPSRELLDALPVEFPGSDEALFAAAATAYIGMRRGRDLRPLYRLLDSVLDAAIRSSNTGSDAFATAVETLFVIVSMTGRPDHAQRYLSILALMPSTEHRELEMLGTVLDPARISPDMAEFIAAAAEAEQPSDPRLVGILSYACLFIDKLHVMRSANERLVRQGSDEVVARMHLSTEAWRLGRWDVADQLIAEGREICARLLWSSYSSYFDMYRARMAAVRGEAAVALGILDRLFDSQVSRDDGLLRDQCRMTLALEALARQDYVSAFAHATRIAEPGSMPVNAPVALWVFFELILAGVHSGHTREAQLHLDEVIRLDVARLSPRYRLLVAASQAVLLDRASASSTLLGAALKEAGLDLWPFDLARVHLLQAEFLLTAGLLTEAKPQADAALATMTRLGARPWAEQAAKLLGRITNREATSNVFGLSATELKVVGLAAGGLTNKQIGQRLFLSDRTVSSHLYHAFPKLGITRRAALRDAIAELQEDGIIADFEHLGSS